MIACSLRRATVAERTREDELREVPLWRANKGAWPSGVRPIGMEEIDCVGVDRLGNLYWDGKPVEVSVSRSRMDRKYGPR
jgi:hypothetical protein